VTATDLDPWADPDTKAGEDSGEFLTTEELIGRNVIIVPQSIESIPGEGSWPDGRVKTDYDRITADVIVLDGRRNTKIKAFPHIERGKYVSAFKVVAELRKYVGTGTPVLGYFTQVNKAYFLEIADAEVAGAASTKAAWKLYKEGSTAKDQAENPPF